MCLKVSVCLIVCHAKGWGQHENSLLSPLDQLLPLASTSCSGNGPMTTYHRLMEGRVRALHGAGLGN